MTQDELTSLLAVLCTQIKADQVFCDALQRKLALPDIQVVGIGYGGLVGKQFSLQTTTSDEFYQIFSQIIQKRSEELAHIKGIYTANIVPSIAMLYAVLQTFDFKKIEWKDIPAGKGAFHHLYPNAI